MRQGGGEGSSITSTVVSANRYRANVAGWPRAVVWGLGAQLALVALVGLGAYLVDRIAGFSVVLGGLSSFLPNAYFAFRLFETQRKRVSRHLDGREAADLDEEEAGHLATGELGAFLRAETGKLVLMAVLLVMAFSLVDPLNAGALIGGFVLTHLVHILVMFGSNLTEN